MPAAFIRPESWRDALRAIVWVGGATLLQRVAADCGFPRSDQSEDCRLRQGEAHAGWVLKVIMPREMTFKRDDRTEVLGLKRQAPPISGAATGQVLPAAGVAATSFAPFVARSTPKNGESDGFWTGAHWPWLFSREGAQPMVARAMGLENTASAIDNFPAGW
jgi:hypothetical protein